MADENENQAALDIMNSALDGTLGEAETPAGDESEHEETPSGEEGEAGGETPAGEEGETSAGEEGAKTPEELAAEEAAAAAGRERNPDGTFKKPEVKAGEKPGEKPGEKKAPDALNDPIPKDLKPATQERIRTLVKTAREVTAERDEIKSNFDYVVQGIQATGATTEQYAETLSWLALFNSNDPEQQSKALELVENVADRLSTLLGKERTVSDPLSAHQDLKEAVQKGHITPQYAREIARTRAQGQFRQEIQTAATTEQQTREAAQQELGKARADLTALEKNLVATDPNYAAKRAVLVPILKPIFETLPPSQWAARFQQAYKDLKMAAKPTPAPATGGARKGVPVNQPMRANKTPAGGQSKAPGSAMEALDAALSNMK